MSDESTKRAAKLLLEGATMLNISCPECSNPIYKLRDGNMKCANCNKEVVFESDEVKMQKLRNRTDPNSPVQKKIEALTKQLEEEEDPDKIIKLAETIKKLKEIL